MTTPLPPGSTFVCAQLLIGRLAMQHGDSEEEQDSGENDDEDRVHAERIYHAVWWPLFFQPIALKRSER